MKLFIDFDDVILNTKESSGDLRNFFHSNGVCEELFRKHYYAPEDADSEIKLFNPWGLLDRLEKCEGLDVGKLRQFFAEHIAVLSSFVFPDVRDFLLSIGKENIFLVSFGLPKYQNDKIVASGVNELVNGCIVTKGSKAEAIEKVLQQLNIPSKEKIIFIDDRVEQIKTVKEKFPECSTFFLCRKEGRYCDQKNQFCDYEVHDLEEAKEIIDNINQ